MAVSEESTAEFDPVKIENSRKVSGSGDVKANQGYSGSKGFHGKSALSAFGSVVALTGSATLTPGTLSAEQTASISGSCLDFSQAYAGSGGYDAGCRVNAIDAHTGLRSNVYLTPGTLSLGQGTYISGVSGEVSLFGEQGDESARQYASFEGGRLNSGQGMVAGHSVYTSQGTTLVADKGTISSEASVGGNQATTGLFGMINPAIVAEMGAVADGAAMTGQISFAVADGGYAGSSADDSNGAHTDVSLKLKDGFALTAQGSEAGPSLVPTATLKSLAAGGSEGSIEFDAHSRYPAPGAGYLSYSSAIGPGEEVPVSEGKEWWEYIPKIKWPWDENEKEGLRSQISVPYGSGQGPFGSYHDPYKGDPDTIVNQYTQAESGSLITEYADGSISFEVNGAEIRLSKEDLNLNVCIKAIGSSGCIQADVGDAKKAVILEPMYTAFLKVANDPGQSDAPYETQGDAALRYLTDSGYATWRYADTAATAEHFQELDDFDMALIVSHMNDYSIALSTRSPDTPDVEEGIYAWDLKNWYTNPRPGSAVILSGCDSAGPGFGGAYQLSLFGALDKAGTVAGYDRSVYTGWDADYTSELFKYMYEHPGSGMSEAQNYLWTNFRPSWELRHFAGPYVTPLVFQGDGNWALDERA